MTTASPATASHDAIQRLLESTKDTGRTSVGGVECVLVPVAALEALHAFLTESADTIERGLEAGPGTSLEEVRRLNVMRCEAWHPGGVADWSAADWLVATAGELGELALEVCRQRASETLGTSQCEVTDLAVRAVSYLGLACNAVKKLRRLEDGAERGDRGDATSLIHTAESYLGLCAEHLARVQGNLGVGELRGEFVYGDAFGAEDLDKGEIRQGLRDEAGGTFLYLDLLTASLGFPLADAVREGFDRVSRREGLPYYFDEEPPGEPPGEEA